MGSIGIDPLTVLIAVGLAVIGGLGTRVVTRNLSVVAEGEGVIKGLEHDEHDDYGKHASPPQSA